MPLSPSSSPSPSPADPIATIALPAPNPNPNPHSNRRGLPPLCWTDEETLALIDCYREKWYSHNRSNLRAAHWDEVAAAVAARSRQIPTATPKTSVQCRHKIEKLRKRYRAERQRSLALNPRGPPSSPWIFFGKIDQMENPNPNPNPNWYGEEVGNGGLRFKIPVALRNPNPNWDRECDDDGGDGNVVASNGGGGSAGGLKSKIPMAVQASVGNPNPNASWAIPIGIPNPNFNLAKEGMDEVRRRMEAKRRREEEEEEEDDDDDDEGLDGIGEMAKALRMLGDGYMRMEQMKMDMAREMEQARMDMELKRTEMILDTQRRIVDGFVKGYAGEKKVKRSTDS